MLVKITMSERQPLKRKLHCGIWTYSMFKSTNSYNNRRPCYELCLLAEAIISGFTYLSNVWDRIPGSEGRAESQISPPCSELPGEHKNKGKAVLEVL